MRALVADGKGRVTFGLFAGVALLAVIGMSLFVFRTVAMGSQAYPVELGTVFYDVDDSYVKTEAPGTAQRRWDGTWSVGLETGESYDLGKHGVLYAAGSDELALLGDAWLVREDASVESHSGRTVVDASAPALYKQNDRRYVLAAPQIACEEAGIDTAPYVIVRMDRAGNAWIANHEMNVKTVKPLVLAADDVRLDVANERLQTVGEDGSVLSDVDLSKIGGSTNEYEPMEDIDGDGDVDADDTAAGAGGAGGTTVIGGGSASASGGAGGSSSSSSGAIAGGLVSGTGGADGSDEDSGESGAKPNENPNAGITPQLTLTGTSSNVTSVTFDYRVYDPNGKFASVYALIQPVQNGVVGAATKVLLNSGSTTKTVYGLAPNSVYRITLGYTLYKTTGEGETDHTADFINVTTKAMGVSVTVPALSSSAITARVNANAAYPLDSVELVLYSKGAEIARQQVDTARASTSGGWTTTFANPGTKSFELRLENAKYQGEDIELSASCSVKNNVTHSTTS